MVRLKPLPSENPRMILPVTFVVPAYPVCPRKKAIKRAFIIIRVFLSFLPMYI